MKLLRYGPKGIERPGLLDEEGRIRCLAEHVRDINGEVLSDDSIAALRALSPDDLPLVGDTVRLGPCVADVGKFLCIGLNYADHAEESGMPIPVEPEVFTKATSAICGPNDNIVQPLNSDKLDWEVELASTPYTSEKNKPKTILPAIASATMSRNAGFSSSKAPNGTKAKDATHSAP